MRKTTSTNSINEEVMLARCGMSLYPFCDRGRWKPAILFTLLKWAGCATMNCANLSKEFLSGCWWRSCGAGAGWTGETHHLPGSAALGGIRAYGKMERDTKRRC